MLSRIDLESPDSKLGQEAGSGSVMRKIAPPGHLDVVEALREGERSAGGALSAADSVHDRDVPLFVARVRGDARDQHPGGELFVALAKDRDRLVRQRLHGMASPERLQRHSQTSTGPARCSSNRGVSPITPARLSDSDDHREASGGAARSGDHEPIEPFDREVPGLESGRASRADAELPPDLFQGEEPVRCHDRVTARSGARSVPEGSSSSGCATPIAAGGRKRLGQAHASPSERHRGSLCHIVVIVT